MLIGIAQLKRPGLFVEPTNVVQESLHILVRVAVTSLAVAGGRAQGVPVKTVGEALIDAGLKRGGRFVSILQINPPRGVGIAPRIQMATRAMQLRRRHKLGQLFISLRS